MAKALHFSLKTLAAMSLLLLGQACTVVETQAYGYVVDHDTQLPVAGARVVQLAVFNRKQEIVCEAYTDSLGYFEICNGEQNFGLRRQPKLEIIVAKAGYFPTTKSNLGLEMQIELYK